MRENIAAFGGDPDRGTIAGESAGAFIVAALVASPYGGVEHDEHTVDHLRSVPRSDLLRAQQAVAARLVTPFTPVTAMYWPLQWWIS